MKKAQVVLLLLASFAGMVFFARNACAYQQTIVPGPVSVSLFLAGAGVLTLVTRNR